MKSVKCKVLSVKCTVGDGRLEYEKSFRRDRIWSTDTVLKANASGVRIWHKCS